MENGSFSMAMSNYRSPLLLGSFRTSDDIGPSETPGKEWYGMGVFLGAEDTIMNHTMDNTLFLRLQVIWVLVGVALLMSSVIRLSDPISVDHMLLKVPVIRGVLVQNVILQHSIWLATKIKSYIYNLYK